ncbi:DUF6491 family protein [Oleisolibacter albus]|uniref:DUF6491 family protein n=1 Tax=Oleisolibacter albus TaxID=2171757 RepID=UPI000DF21181|nr:DUF6491 family protein [Oleisolibacter albus]
MTRHLYIILPLLLAGCAADSSPDAGPAGTAVTSVTAGDATSGAGTACTWSSGLRNWKRVDRQHLLLQTDDGWYRAELGGLCDADLDDVTTLALGSTAGTVCPMDAIFLNGQRCTITGLFKMQDQFTGAQRR